MLILGLASTETVDSSAPDLAEATVKKVSALQRFWNNINWDAIVATLIEKSLSILFLIFLFFLFSELGNYLFIPPNPIIVKSQILVKAVLKH